MTRAAGTSEAPVRCRVQARAHGPSCDAGEAGALRHRSGDLSRGRRVFGLLPARRRAWSRWSSRCPATCCACRPCTPAKCSTGRRLLPHAGKHFQARALNPVTALAFEGEQLLASFRSDPEFGLAFMLRLMGVVSERLRATRLQLRRHVFAGGQARRHVSGSGRGELRPSTYPPCVGGALPCGNAALLISLKPAPFGRADHAHPIHQAPIPTRSAECPHLSSMSICSAPRAPTAPRR